MSPGKRVRCCRGTHAIALDTDSRCPYEFRILDQRTACAWLSGVIAPRIPGLHPKQPSSRRTSRRHIMRLFGELFKKGRAVLLVLGNEPFDGWRDARQVPEPGGEGSSPFLLPDYQRWNSRKRMSPRGEILHVSVI
jgi:hypothetical protein